MRALQLMTERAHEHGALAGVELWHGGVYAESREARLPQLAPSPDRQRLTAWSVPKAMDRHDIRRAQGSGSTAARRAREAGFDIVYVYGAHTLPALAVPVAGVQPAHRRVRRLVREPGPVLAGGDRAGQGGGRRRLRGRRADRVDTLELSGSPIEEGLEFIRAADHLVDLWDVVSARCRERPARLRPLAVLRPRATSCAGRAGRERRPRSRSSWSAGSPTPTGWPTWCAPASST